MSLPIRVKATEKYRMLINLQDMDLPRGFNFNPKDEDAIFFLNEKVSGRPLPPQPYGGGGRMILELDPYEREQLPDIFAATVKLGCFFFFTKLTRKTKSANFKSKSDSNNVDRTVRGKTKASGGGWHCHTKHKEIKDGHKKVIGISRKLSYRPAPGTRNRSSPRYIMTEYLLNATNYDIFKDWVLCRLVKKNKRKDGEEVEDPPAAMNSPCEGVESPAIGVPPYQTVADFEGVDLGSLRLADPPEFPAANSGSPMAAEYARRCKVDQASVIKNLPFSSAAGIQPLQTLGGFEHWDNQVMAYDSNTCCEAPAMNNVFPLEYSTTTAVEDGDQEICRAIMAMNL